MDIKALDKALQEIIKRKSVLGKLTYNDPTYDDLEEELHDLEDDFQEAYGEYLEAALQTVHDQFCPDNDVLMPIAYINGIPVEVDKLPGKDTKLFIEAKPPRIILAVGTSAQQVLWTAK
ncbi:MAG TPA: hypothetical protein PLJ60_03930 [Chryseolinea sp.]|nr:hypothetical protein [Chryseolinea sp.]HPM29465.1 hypothetical protein [Chryseolinea sp.]